MSNSVASGYSSRVRRNHQRKYNIAPELLASPYLSSPIGSFNNGDKKKRSGSPRGDARKKSPRRKREENNTYASDVESVVTRGSVTSYRTRDTTTTFRRHSHTNSAQRLMSSKNFLLPREVDKILRVFRQKHGNHPILKNDSGEAHRNHDDYDGDNSTIASDSVESLDDEAVYLHCLKDEHVKNALFSGPLFAEIALRNASQEIDDGEPTLTLPPVVDGTHQQDKSEDISDLESTHSMSESRHSRSKSKGVPRIKKR